jgi:hypothetical protein
LRRCKKFRCSKNIYHECILLFSIGVKKKVELEMYIFRVGPGDTYVDINTIMVDSERFKKYHKLFCKEMMF